MKKDINQIEYSCKGMLSLFNNNIIEVIAKGEVTDTVDINDFAERMAVFCEEHMDENIEIKLIAKSTVE